VRGTEQGIINAGHKGLRIAAVMQPTAIDGHALSIRRHRKPTSPWRTTRKPAPFRCAMPRPRRGTHLPWW
jgi:hypothetical protein